MAADNPFVDEVRANPHDDAARLIYADYLDDAGDPRGELIRVQIGLAELPVGNPERRQLALRERELLDAYGERWLEPLRQLGVEGVSIRCFQRGLIERARISAAAFIRNSRQLCEIAPALYCLELREIGLEEGQSLVLLDMPEQITALDLSSNPQPLPATTLFSAEWMRQIKELAFEFAQLTDTEIPSLAESHVARLEVLKLSVNSIGPAGAEAIAIASWAPELRVLELSSNPITDAGVRALASSGQLAKLEDLNVARCGIGDAGATALAESARLPQLRRLNLRRNEIGTEGLNALATSSTLRLTHLDVRANQAPVPKTWTDRFALYA